MVNDSILVYLVCNGYSDLILKNTDTATHILPVACLSKTTRFQTKTEIIRHILEKFATNQKSSWATDQLTMISCHIILYCGSNSVSSGLNSHSLSGSLFLESFAISHNFASTIAPESNRC